MPDEPLSARIEWLRRAGVTHVLSFNPLNEAEWPVRPVWQGFDPLLNPAWARYREPLYLYELRESRGRVAWEKPAGQTVPKVTELAPSPHRDRGRFVRRRAADTDRVDLSRLAVAIDGKPAQPLTIERMFRGVDVPSGRHQVVWSSIRAPYTGLAVSG